jgi:hypothetical protein
MKAGLNPSVKSTSSNAEICNRFELKGCPAAQPAAGTIMAIRGATSRLESQEKFNSLLAFI